MSFGDWERQWAREEKRTHMLTRYNPAIRMLVYVEAVGSKPPKLIEKIWWWQWRYIKWRYR